MTALSIINALDSPALFKPWFAGPSWATWRSVLKGVYGLPLAKAERSLFHAVAERDPPKQRVREFWAVCGRRAGKDSVASAIAAHSAAFFQDGDRLRPGERALVLCVANDRDQARIVLGYIRAFFELPMLKPMVTRATRDGLELSNSVDIAVVTNDFRAVRGRPILCAILDEVAFYRDENYASPDVELLRAIEPGLLTLPSSMLIAISSPYRRSGILFEKWKRHYGQDGDVLVIRAASRLMNPTLDQRRSTALSPMIEPPLAPNISPSGDRTSKACSRKRRSMLRLCPVASNCRRAKASHTTDSAIRRAVRRIR
jgi:hypothetical protein